MDEHRRSLLRPISALLLVSQLAGAAPALAATAPAKPAATTAATYGLVLRAQGYYRDARYDEAVGLLAGPVMRKELAGQELIDARVVLARCYVKKGITPRAKEHFGAILAIDPTYTLSKSQADAEELAVFNEVKASHGTAVPAPAVAAAGKAAPPAAAAAKGTPPATTTGKGATTDPTAAKAAPPATTAPAAPSAQAQPPMHKPETEPSGGEKKSWLSRNKYLALGLLVGTGVAVGVAASGGGSDDGATATGTSALPGFPGVPPGH